MFRCPECERAVCDDCTHHAWTSTGFIDRCLACDVPLVKLGKDRTGLRRARLSYLQRATEAVTLLGNPSSLLLMAGLTLLVAPVVGVLQYVFDWGMAMLGRALVFALESTVYLAVIAQTASGESEVHPPDITHVEDDVVRPTLRYLAASLPIAIGILWFVTESTSSLRLLDVVGGQPQALLDEPMPALLIVVGMFLLPLLTLVAATCYSISAVLNPVVWVRALQVVGSDYFLAMVLFHSVFAFEVFVWLPWLADLYWQLDIPVLVLVATTFLGYLPMFVRARLLGLLIEPRYEQFT